MDIREGYNTPIIYMIVYGCMYMLYMNLYMIIGIQRKT
jgi:hypothetical protein